MFVNTIHFPCWGLSMSSPVEDVSTLAQTLLEWRENDRWLLLGRHAAISEKQLWTAWAGVGGRKSHDTMRSHSLDAEFIRLIAGTHQIRIGFERAGVANGDNEAWLVYLPEFWTTEINDAEWPELDLVALDEEADRLMRVLDAKLLTHRPISNSATIDRLNLELGHNEEHDDHSAIERAALSHIALADLA
jgi:tRNA threonylcarbamoyladenosine modification (KEOPS) complex Cgi121 subunit